MSYDSTQSGPTYEGRPRPMPDQQVAPPPRSKKSLGIGLKIFYVIGIVLFAAAAVGLFTLSFSDRSEISMLKEDGVLTEADVGAVTTTTRRNQSVYNYLTVSFQPDGAAAPVSAKLMDCSDFRWEPGMSRVDVVYLPDDPEVARLSECGRSAGVFPAVLGTVFAAIALFMLWRVPRKSGRA